MSGYGTALSAQLSGNYFKLLQPRDGFTTPTDDSMFVFVFNPNPRATYPTLLGTDDVLLIFSQRLRMRL